MGDSNNSSRRMRWTIGGAALALALALAGHFLPDLGLRWGLTRILHDLGWPRVMVRDADLSLFNGAIVIHRVEAGEELGKQLGLEGLDFNFRWMPLFSRRVSAERLALTGLTIDVSRTDKGFEINGLPVAVEGGGASDWSFDIQSLSLADSRIDLTDGAFKAVLQVDSLEIRDLKSWEPSTTARVALKGRLNGASLAVTGTMTPFSGRPGFALTLDTDNLDLAPLAELGRRAGLDKLAGRLTAHAVLEGGVGSDLKFSGHAEAGDLSLSQNDLTLRAGHLRLEVKSGRAGSDKLTAQGKAEAARLDLNTGSVNTLAARFTAEGQLESAPGNTITGQVDAMAEQLLLRDPGLDWLWVHRLEAHSVTFAANGIGVASLDATAIGTLGGRESFPWRLEAGQAHAERAFYGKDGLVSAQLLNLGGAIMRVTRVKGGFLGLPQGSGEPSQPLVVLGRLRLPGDGKLEFEDRSTSEPVRLRLDAMDLTLSDVDSRVERDSPFTVKARSGSGRLSASGKVRPFAALPGGDMTGRVQAMDLPPLSPYAADNLGVHLRTGQLEADMALAIRQGKLDGTMTLALSQLFVDQPDPNAPLAKRTEMPVATVLDLLRDSEDRIRLTIPVRGDLANPDFDLSDGVNQAIGSALRSTVLTTLKVAFPVVALIGLVIDEAETPRLALEPLTFGDGGEALGEPERKRLTNIGQLMSQRPALKLRLCGIATTSDWQPLLARQRREELSVVARLQQLMGVAPAADAMPPNRDDRLSQLAEARALAAKTFLVEQAGIEPGRLYACRPRLDKDGKGGPRVELLF